MFGCRGTGWLNCKGRVNALPQAEEALILAVSPGSLPGLHRCKPARWNQSLLLTCQVLRQVLEPRSPVIALHQIDSGLSFLCVRIGGAVGERLSLAGDDHKMKSAILRSEQVVICGITCQLPSGVDLSQSALLIHI